MSWSGVSAPSSKTTRSRSTNYAELLASRKIPPQAIRVFALSPWPLLQDHVLGYLVNHVHEDLGQHVQHNRQQGLERDKATTGLQSSPCDSCPGLNPTNPTHCCAEDLNPPPRGSSASPAIGTHKGGIGYRVTTVGPVPIQTIVNPVLGSRIPCPATGTHKGGIGYRETNVGPVPIQTIVDPDLA